MKVNWTGGIPLLKSRGFWAAVVTAVLAVTAAFGTAPKKQWAYVKHPDGSVSEVDPANLVNLPSGDVLMEGIEADQMRQKIWTDRLLGIGTFISTIAAGYFLKKDPNITSYLPPSSGPNLPSVLWAGGATGVVCVLVLGACGGCSNAERLEYAAYRDADFNGTSVMRAEQRLNSRTLAGDKNNDGHITADEVGPVDPVTGVPTTPIDLSALPNLSKLTTTERDAWLRAREEELDQSQLRYQNSKAQDEKAASNTGPFGFFGTLFAPKPQP